MRQILCRARLAFGSPERSSLARCHRQSQLLSKNSLAPPTPSRYKHLSVYRYRLSVRTVLGAEPLTVISMLVAESGVLLGTSAWHSPSACSASRACSRRGSPPRFQLAPTVALRE